MHLAEGGTAGGLPPSSSALPKHRSSGESPLVAVTRAPMPPKTDTTLEGHRLCVNFVGLRALDAVSIQLHRHEILGLIGPNGSGKTTLVNVLCGQIAPAEGRTYCNGRDITSLPPREISRRGVARTFQIVRVFANLTVRENVEVATVAHGASRRAARREADALLHEFGLSARSEDPAGILSYGDKRRVEIARALAADPHFLLLDEPSFGLAPTIVDRIFEIIVRLRETGLTILLVEQNAGKAPEVADRAYVMRSGRVAASGSASEIAGAYDLKALYLGA